ncbi:TPA: hypothetical protein JG831_004755 [Vibrio parahaemolyticus]|nr:hypothetical protein [Vibrio parahaemolyticus]
MEMLTSAVLGGGMTRYAAVLNLGQNATDDELDYIDEHMLYIIEKESGKKISVEDFDGAWDVREQLVMGALEANYGSFFDYLGLIGKEHLKALEENQAKTTGTI